MSKLLLSSAFAGVRLHHMADQLASFCPRYHHAVELIGRRWTGAVIRVLLGGRARYHELRDAVPDISDRMLAERLRELEQEGVIDRVVVPETPVRVEYELTDKGRALEPVVRAIAAWAERWVVAESDQRTTAPR
jgi:DNA-binding HxlR family transcriptional regulator